MPKAKNAGVVDYVSVQMKLELREIQMVEQIFINFLKFKRSNQGTCINQRPIVDKGEIVFKNQVISRWTINRFRRNCIR